MTAFTVQLSPDARTDLNDIYAYTVEKFGKPQAVKYFRDINKAFDLLRNNPKIGRARDVDGIFGDG